MNARKSKVLGTLNRAIGGVKRKVGELTNSSQLKRQGRKQIDKGRTQSISGDVKKAAHGLSKKMKRSS